ncbi:proton-associated sugar transporter A-like [Ornithodoros turicata]|uniref:proton-associated sugar transporter A-like n=1 Tax=Ornithodoros turicata TaxID=34597 RepID=UPI003138E227
MNEEGMKSPTKEIMRRYAHIFRKKTFLELVILSGAVCGIEFCYAAETAYIGPILLSLGVPIWCLTLTMCLSPAIGFFVTPLLGSLSDTCESTLGRRRPFIILLSFGMLVGLVLIPNGKDIGVVMGDSAFVNHSMTNVTPRILVPRYVSASEEKPTWGIFFTIIGFVFLDMCSDSCQSPSRTYVLEVTTSDDQTRALTTFTVMSGLGGTLGYIMGGIKWESTSLGNLLGGHIRTVFAIVTVLFIICTAATLTSFEEMPLEASRLALPFISPDAKVGKYTRFVDDEEEGQLIEMQKYGTVDMMRRGVLQEVAKEITEAHQSPSRTEMTAVGVSLMNESVAAGDTKGLTDYLKSILYMPHSLRILCLTNYFCWMSLVSYSLYFTEFVGAAVFNGDPVAPKGSDAFQRYQDGVRFGCFGLSTDTLACSVYSLVIEKLVGRFGAKPVYIAGQLVYSVGMILMAMLRSKAAVLLLSPTTGVMYATLFTMPYILVAHYHSSQMVEHAGHGGDWSQRGLGTDIAIVSSMMFPAQLSLSLGMGPLVQWAGSPVAIVAAAAVLSTFGAVCATRVTYLRL